MNAVKLKGYNSYFIHIDGYVFKTTGFKEERVPLKIVKHIPKIIIGGQSYNLLFLMIEYFGSKTYSYNDYNTMRFKYKVVDNKIPFKHIKIIEYNSNVYSDPRIHTYKCKDKSLSANGRVNNISVITEGDVFDSLLRTDFKCFYCNRKLNKNTWELDHIEPLSKNGLNISTNLAASCKECNRMKSNIDIMHFIHSCKMIAENFKDSVLLDKKTFKLKS
jgi:5-methylcytosine-specific restriction endonuclease McrA